MREIKVMIFRGDIAKLSESNFQDVVQQDAFRRSNGMAVQQYQYTCAMQRDRVGTVFDGGAQLLGKFSVFAHVQSPFMNSSKHSSLRPSIPFSVCEPFAVEI